MIKVIRGLLALCFIFSTCVSAQDESASLAPQAPELSSTEGSETPTTGVPQVSTPVTSPTEAPVTLEVKAGSPLPAGTYIGTIRGAGGSEYWWYGLEMILDGKGGGTFTEVKVHSYNQLVCEPSPIKRIYVNDRGRIVIVWECIPRTSAPMTTRRVYFGDFDGRTFRGDLPNGTSWEMKLQ